MKSAQQKRTEALARRERDVTVHTAGSKKHVAATRDVANLRRKLGIETKA